MTRLFLTLITAGALALAIACQPDVEPPEPAEPVVPEARATTGGESP